MNISFNIFPSKLPPLPRRVDRSWKWLPMSRLSEYPLWGWPEWPVQWPPAAAATSGWNTDPQHGTGQTEMRLSSQLLCLGAFGCIIWSTALNCIHEARMLLPWQLPSTVNPGVSRALLHSPDRKGRMWLSWQLPCTVSLMCPVLRSPALSFINHGDRQPVN